MDTAMGVEAMEEVIVTEDMEAIVSVQNNLPNNFNIILKISENAKTFLLFFANFIFTFRWWPSLWRMYTLKVQL